MGDRSIPEDVREKLLRFGRAAVAVGQMRGKSYLSIGSVSMGIAGSIPDPAFFQEYLGMRSEYVDASEIERRVRLGIYDPEEFRRAMAWTEKYCKKNEGRDYNPEHLVYSREEKDAIWEYVVKMTLIFRDLMTGNPKLAGMGFEEEAMDTTPLPADFRPAAVDRLQSPTGISRRRYSTPRSTGTASARPSPSPRRTTR